MGVRLILGRAGSGKTSLCLGEIAAECARNPEGAPIILLTPEQAAYEAERGLVERCGGYARARVLGFTRLVEFVFAEQPAPTLPRLTAVHRMLLCARLVQRGRRRQPPSQLFAIRGIERTLADFAAEARRFGLDPRRLREAADSARTLGLQGKARDLANFLDDFEAALRGRFQDPADSLSDLARAIMRSTLLQGAEVYLDGFYSFTPAEERAIGALMRRCRRVTLVFTCDGARGSAAMSGENNARHPVFGPIEDTLVRLRRIVDESEASLDEAVVLNASDAGSAIAPPIAAIERGFMESRAPRAAIAGGAVRMIVAPSHGEEARIAAELCAQWIGADGIDPGKIAVIARSLEDYAPHLGESFRALRLPHFIDRVEPVTTHPFVTGLGSALRAVGRRWNADDVIDFAVGGLAPVSRREADELAAHCVGCPPLPDDWKSEKPWLAPVPRTLLEDEQAGDARARAIGDIDVLRRRVAAPLRLLERALRRPEGAPFRDVIEAVTALVDEWVQRQDAAAMAEDDFAILARLGELLAEADDALGDERLDCDEAVEQVLSLLDQLSLPRIPPLLGQVLLAQVDRSRFPPLDAAILVGLDAAQWPHRPRNSSVLNDDERDELLEGRIELGDSSKRRFARENFNAYLALTRASSRLVVLRSLASDAGGPIEPSPYWEELERLLPEGVAELWPSRDEPSRAMRPAELAAAFSRRVIRSHDVAPAMSRDSLRALAGGLGEWPEARAVFDAALDMNRATLDVALLRELFEGNWRASVSSLESFASCPFRHFVRAMLRPREHLAPEPDSRDAGNVAHALMKEAADRLITRGQGFGDLDQSAAVAIWNEAVAVVRSRAERWGIFRSLSSRAYLDGAIEATHEFYEWMCAAGRAFPSKPQFTELPFGFKGEGAVPAITSTIRLGEHDWQTAVRGRIDRADILSAATGDVFVVIDYKLKGKHAFSLADWAHGLDLQLPVYLLAAGPAFIGARPGGALNAWVVPAADDRESRDAGDFGAVRMKGICRSSIYATLRGPAGAWKSVPFIQGAEGDPDKDPRPRWGTAAAETDFDAMVAKTSEIVRGLLARVFEGDVAVAPVLNRGHLACEMCDYAAICRIDHTVNEAREIATRSRAEVLADLAGGTP